MTAYPADRASRVVVCGVGTVTGYGWGVDPFWSGLSSGKSAAQPFDDVRPWPWPDEPVWMARVADEGNRDDGASRFARALRASAREAIHDALGRGWSPGRRVGLIHAVVLGEVDLWRDLYLSPDRRLSRREYLALMPSTPIATTMREFGFHGPSMGVSAMCASGNAALLTARMWLAAGVCEDVVVATTDLSLTPENLRYFRELGVAVTNEEPLEVCRPFQSGSKGFVMGEASVAMVVTTRGRLRRDASPYATVLGGALTNDGYHVVSIDPTLSEVSRCFEDAMADAKVAPSAVRWLNAHGSGTEQCDTAERVVLQRLLGDDTQVYSMKPLIGHCQGASSGTELAVTVLGYERGVVPAPYVTAEAHPRLLDGPTPIGGGVTVKSSLGMGGHNAVVVLDAA